MVGEVVRKRVRIFTVFEERLLAVESECFGMTHASKVEERCVLLSDGVQVVGSGVVVVDGIGVVVGVVGGGVVVDGGGVVVGGGVVDGSGCVVSFLLHTRERIVVFGTVVIEAGVFFVVEGVVTVKNVFVVVFNVVITVDIINIDVVVTVVVTVDVTADVVVTVVVTADVVIDIFCWVVRGLVGAGGVEGGVVGTDLGAFVDGGWRLEGGVGGGIEVAVRREGAAVRGERAGRGGKWSGGVCRERCNVLEAGNVCQHVVLVG